MEKGPYNKLPRVDLHGGAGSMGPTDRETRYKGCKLNSTSDKEDNQA